MDTALALALTPFFAAGLIVLFFPTAIGGIVAAIVLLGGLGILELIMRH